MGRVGIREVAERAGVALGTVSRVLNDHPSVTPEVRRRVKAVIAELQYEPDANARGMRSKTSRLIGIVVPDLANPFFAELVQNVERAAQGFGHSVIMMSSQENAGVEGERIRSLASRKVDGIVVVPSNGFHEIAVPKGLPMILVDRVAGDHPAVTADHRAGARAAVEYLIGLGHRRIACIAGPAQSPPAADRLAGYEEAMNAHFGHDPDRSAALVVHASFDYEGGGAGGRALLARAPGARPTAVFASSDQQAIGCLRAASDLGLSVPRAVSVIGFDGIFVANVVTPRLTTVVQPAVEIAEAAVAALVGATPLPAVGRPLRLACRVVERESCAVPPVDGA